MRLLSDSCQGANALVSKYALTARNTIIQVEQYKRESRASPWVIYRLCCCTQLAGWLYDFNRGLKNSVAKVSTPGCQWPMLPLLLLLVVFLLLPQPSPRLQLIVLHGLFLLLLQLQFLLLLRRVPLLCGL